MAAKLSYKNGLAEMLLVGETPWHREGFKFDRTPSWSELMAVVDYDLEKRPYWYPAAVEGGTEMRESDEAFYVARKDNNAVLGVVGSQYEPIPNRDARSLLEYIGTEGSMRIALPPEVAEAISRQRDALTARNRRAAARQQASLRKAAGIRPAFLKTRKKPKADRYPSSLRAPAARGYTRQHERGHPHLVRRRAR